MANSEAHEGRGPTRPPMEEALGRLEERLDRASQAAERLLADAAQRVTKGDEPATPPPDGEPGKPPPAGWQQSALEDESSSPLLGDADLLLALFGAVRDRIPPDLQQRLAEAVRELLLAVRALIDWYLERAERARSQPAEVQDIPIL